MEQTAGAYEKLAGNEQVQAALARVGEGRGLKVKLGPSAFAQELTRWRRERARIESADIEVVVRDGVGVTQVTLNGATTVPMVVDSGASVVVLTLRIL